MKKLALSLIFALTISLAACGAEAPPTVSGEPLPEASAAATSWNGKGACYTAEPVINGKNEWMGCSFDYAGESFSLVSAEDGTLRVLAAERGSLTPRAITGSSCVPTRAVSGSSQVRWAASCCGYIALRAGC